MADDDDNVVEADSARVTRHGSLWRSRPQAKKKKLFYVLTDAVLFAFKSERAYRSQAAPVETLPLYDVAAVPRLEHAPVPHKSPKHFHLLTSFGVLRLKSSSVNAAAAWVHAINAACAADAVAERRRRWQRQTGQWVLHVRVLEVRNLDWQKANAGGSFHCHAEVTHVRQDPAPARALPAPWHCQRTSASDAIPPTWNEILSFGAVTPDDVLHVAVYCTASKTMSFFDDTSLQGAFNLDVSRLDLDRDLFGQGRACGLHRWLSLADRYGRESGSQLHLQVYAVPADTVADATMQTPTFLRDRLDLVAAQRPLDDDAIFTQGISVFTGTWNVGETAPPDDLRRWLHRASLCDLVAIASQECVYDPRPPFTTCVDDWVGSLHQALGGPDDYVLVKHESLWGIRIVVFASSRIASLITTPKRRTVATGVGHVLGNKGGACVALQLRHSSFCFVSMHLAAHQVAPTLSLGPRAALTDRSPRVCAAPVGEAQRRPERHPAGHPVRVDDDGRGAPVRPPGPDGRPELPGGFRQPGVGEDAQPGAVQPDDRADPAPAVAAPVRQGPAAPRDAGERRPVRVRRGRLRL